MKRFSKCICLILTLTLLLAFPAQAAEMPETRASNYFTASAVYLYQTSANSFQAWFEVTGTGTMDEIGAKEIRIQRSSDGESWKTVATYYMEYNYSIMIREDRAGHTACVNYTNAAGGYYYRAYYKLYAKDETGTGIWNRYSSSLYIP